MVVGKFCASPDRRFAGCVEQLLGMNIMEMCECKAEIFLDGGSAPTSETSGSTLSSTTDDQFVLAAYCWPRTVDNRQLRVVNAVPVAFSRRRKTQQPAAMPRPRLTITILRLHDMIRILYDTSTTTGRT